MSPAEKGAALLDRVKPDWADKIDLDTFDLSSTIYCIIGQLYPRYHEGLEALGLDHNDILIRVTNQEDYGFYAKSSDDDEWDELQQEWIDLINERKTK